LIIPAAYAFSLWILLAAFGFKVADYSVLFTVGVIICFLLSLVLVLRKYLFRDKDPKRVPERRPFKEQYTAPSAKTAREYESVTKQRELEPVEKRKFEPAPKERPIKTPLFEIRRIEESDEQTPSPELRPARTEKPKLYRTRRDPDLFIAEYSDRIEMYRRGRDGMLYLESTDMKY